MEGKGKMWFIAVHPDAIKEADYIGLKEISGCQIVGSNFYIGRYKNNIGKVYASYSSAVESYDAILETVKDLPNVTCE